MSTKARKEGKEIVRNKKGKDKEQTKLYTRRRK